MSTDLLQKIAAAKSKALVEVAQADAEAHQKAAARKAIVSEEAAKILERLPELVYQGVLKKEICCLLYCAPSGDAEVNERGEIGAKRNTVMETVLGTLKDMKLKYILDYDAFPDKLGAMFNDKHRPVSVKSYPVKVYF